MSPSRFSLLSIPRHCEMGLFGSLELSHRRLLRHRALTAFNCSRHSFSSRSMITGASLHRSYMETYIRWVTPYLLTMDTCHYHSPNVSCCTYCAGWLTHTSAAWPILISSPTTSSFRPLKERREWLIVVWSPTGMSGIHLLWRKLCNILLSSLTLVAVCILHN